MDRRAPLRVAVVLLLAAMVVPHRDVVCQVRYTGLLSLYKYQAGSSVPSPYYGAKVSFRKVNGRFQAKEGRSGYFGLRAISGVLGGASQVRRLSNGCKVRWILASHFPVKPKIPVCLRTVAACGSGIYEDAMWCGIVKRSG